MWKKLRQICEDPAEPEEEKQTEPNPAMLAKVEERGVTPVSSIISDAKVLKRECFYLFALKK